MTARSTWRWSMLAGKKEHVSYAYQQFWKNMVLWLTHADDFKQVRIALENKNARLGESTNVRVWVYDEYFKPISDVDVRVTASLPDGKEEQVAMHPETAGVFVGNFKGDRLGAHSLQAWAVRRGKKWGEDRIKFRVIESHFEDEDLRPDFALLKELARVTNGKFVLASEFSPSLFEEFNKEMSTHVGRKILVWNSPWLLGALLVLLVGEWVIRKRRGLP
jgi:hypothetical protein